MRFVRFRHDGTTYFGTTDGEHAHAFAAPIVSVQDYLGVPSAERTRLPKGPPIALGSVQLLAPVVPRKNVFCVGRNYMGHAEEIARARGTTLSLPDVPTFFTKAPTAIADPGATLHLQAAASSEYDWEAELGVVIGERCKDVAESDALRTVFGYTCINDVTARDLQKAHQQWFKGKSLDETCPIGPWIVDAGEFGDPQGSDIALRYDGETKQSSNTSQMIFGVARIIASLSRGMTLEPGDVIATGTPDGVGFARTPPEFLADGSTMEVEIAKIGVLRNRVAIR